MAKKKAVTKKKGAPPEEAQAVEDPIRLATMVYAEVGGFRRFVEWASDEKNIGVFYRDMFLKMLAKGAEASSGEGPIIVRIDNRAKE